MVARDERVGPDATRVVVYEPAGRSRPSGALVWIHGGYWMSLTKDVNDFVEELEPMLRLQGRD